MLVVCIWYCGIKPYLSVHPCLAVPPVIQNWGLYGHTGRGRIREIPSTTPPSPLRLESLNICSGLTPTATTGISGFQKCKTRVSGCRFWVYLITVKNLRNNLSTLNWTIIIIIIIINAQIKVTLSQ